jgi:hypothetical protein
MNSPDTPLKKCDVKYLLLCTVHIHLSIVDLAMKFFMIALFCFVLVAAMAIPLGNEANDEHDHVMVRINSTQDKKCIFF